MAINLSRFLGRKISPRTVVVSVKPVNTAEHGPACLCQGDRSAERWSGTCGMIGSHHTDRHDLFHAIP